MIPGAGRDAPVTPACSRASAGVTGAVTRASYPAMTRMSYLIHRASKRARPSALELHLLDSDLAAAGIQIPWTPTVRADASACIIVVREVHDVLNAA